LFRRPMSGKFNFDFMIIFSLVMVIVYIGVGVYLFVTTKYNYIPTEYKSIFAIFFILYGIFRFVRIYPNLTKRNKNEDE
jgi:hypothetical protein